MYASSLMKYKIKGTGAIIKSRDRFLFVVGKKDYWKTDISPPEITFTNTGGHVDPGEMIEATTKREVLEELNCIATVFHSSTSFYCDLESSQITKYQLTDQVAPLIVYNSSKLKMSVSVYLVHITGKPIPSTEVPALILLPIKLLKGGNLQDLLNNGAILVEQEKGFIPRNARFNPFGSAQILADHWGIIKDSLTITK
ncbi:MAG: NUDIX domain-containing protein [Candidatus Hodarchaeales archaeon]